MSISHSWHKSHTFDLSLRHILLGFFSLTLFRLYGFTGDRLRTSFANSAKNLCFSSLVGNCSAMILTIETNTFAVCCTVSSFSTIALNCSIVKSVSSSGVMRHLLSAAGYTSISTLGSHNTNHPGNAMLLQGNRRLHGAAPYPHNRSQ